MSAASDRSEARRLVQRDDDGHVEVDDKAPVSKNASAHGSDGAYVQAWVWIDDPEALPGVVAALDALVGDPVATRASARGLLTRFAHITFARVHD